MKIDDMTKIQLREYAAESYGEVLDNSLNREAMIARIEELGGRRYQALPEPEKKPNAQGLIDITIHETNDPSGQAYVFVCVQGVATQIPRGVRVSVKPEILEVLDNAVELHLVREAGEYRDKLVKRHNYTIHGRT